MDVTQPFFSAAPVAPTIGTADTPQPALRRRRGARRRSLVAAGGLALALTLGACGGDAAEPDAARATEPRLAFPPTAFEPATSQGGGPTPEGRVKRLGGRPEGLAIEPRSGLLGVALRDRAHTFAILDPASLDVRRTVALSADPRHVGVGDGRFLVPLEDADRLAEITPATGDARLTKVGRAPHAVTSIGDRLFVADEYDDSLTVVRDGKAIGSATVDVQPGGVAAVGGGMVAVVSVRANTISLVDGETLRSGPSQNAGYGPSHAVADSGGRVFVTDTRGGAVMVYETSPRLKFVQRLELGGSPYGIALDETRDRLWVTDSGADEVHELAIDGKLRRIGDRPTVQQPNTVAVDGRTGAVFIASEATGDLQRLEP